MRIPASLRLPHFLKLAFHRGALVCVLLGIASRLATAGAPAAEVFVSASGDDARDGRSRETAFATIERARDEVRRVLAAGGLSEGAVHVNLLPGTFLLDRTVAFTAADSGTPEHPVIYRANEPGSVRLIGARAFKRSDFQPVKDPALLERMDPAARGRIVSLAVGPAGIKHAEKFPDRFDDSGGLFELFVDGNRLPLSRWPNDGAYTLMGRTLVVGDKATPGTFEYRDNRPERWLKSPDVWLKGQWRVGWEDPAIRVARIDPASKTITFAVGIPNGIGCKYNRPDGSGKEPWCAINLLEEIDRPGEWAMDFSTGTLFLWPPSDSPDSEILVSQLAEPLITVDGASHLRFVGLTLESSLGDGIVLNNVDSCLVAGCTVRNLARRGVVLHGTRSGVQSCDISHVGEGCIYVSGGDRKQLIMSENFVLNNHLHHYGVLKKQYSAGVHVGVLGNPAFPGHVLDAVGIRAAHNVIHHAPRDAFLYAGNDNVYEFNEVYYCGYDTRDTGAFYSWLDWTMRGNIIRYNFLHSTVGGVNPDDGASGNFVFGNVFKGPNVGVWIASGPDNTIKNNIFIKDQGSVFGMDDRGTSRKYATNPRLINRVLEIQPDKEPWASAHPELIGMLENQPDLPWRTKFVSNLIVSKDPKPSLLKMKPALVGNPEILLEKDNLTVSGDPGFVDAAAGNYALKPDSEVFQKIPGFEPIPFEKIGLMVDEYRKTLPPPEAFQRGPEHSPYPEDLDKNFGT